MSKDSLADRRAKARKEEIHATRSWDALGHMHVVHIVNYFELLNLIEELEENVQGVGRAMTEDSQTRSNQFLEITRRLHNFVASAVTLVDHTRKLMNNYQGTPTWDEYQTRTADAKKNAVVPLITKLRNYVLHAGLPAIGFQVTINNGIATSYVVYINRDAALRYKDWPAPARRFLENSDENIPLRRLIQDYSKTVEGLYAWLYGQFSRLHGTEIEPPRDLTARVEGRDGPITLVASFPPIDRA